MLPKAMHDLNDIIDYLSQFYPNTVIKQYDCIIVKINTLKKFPMMYEEYPIDVMGFQYRKIVVNKYLVFYMIREDIIEIHRIINSKMDLTKAIN
jgi:toxin ParE1/3/4